MILPIEIAQYRLEKLNFLNNKKFYLFFIFSNFFFFTSYICILPPHDTFEI
jgi:hypothetical protein